MPSTRSSSVDRVVARTSRSLALVTMLLIAALLTAVGVVTAAMVLGATDEGIDRTLESAADSRLAILQAQADVVDELPTPTPTDDDDDSNSGSSSDDDNSGSGSDDDNSGSGSDNSGSGSDNSGSGSDNSGSDDDDNFGSGSGDDDEPRAARTPQATPTPAPTATAIPTATPEPTPSPMPTLGLPSTEQPPQSADTFFLVTSRGGEVISNPQGVALAGLPDSSAITVAASGSEDWRTVHSGDVRVRLLTQPILDSDGDVSGVLQTGFVLSLRDQQTNELLLAIALACIGGLIGAALVTIAVTRNAMQPVRSAFEAERRFVASASHELRTPVSIIRANAEILEREDLVNGEGRKLVDDIISESDRLGRLVTDMLALASAESGAITVVPRPIEMRTFVSALAGRAEGIAAQRNVRLEIVQEGVTARHDAELFVNADPDRMTQLLLIFIDNAIDHSPTGGTVRIFVRPIGRGNRAQVAIGVADEGPGVPVEERSRIFEPFARLSGRKSQNANAGLGLAIARILAARQDAALHVEDAIGGGAVFSVWLPRL